MLTFFLQEGFSCLPTFSSLDPPIISPILFFSRLTKLDSHPSNDLGLMALSLFLVFKGALANCSLCSPEATLTYSAGSACSSFSAKVRAILPAFRWSRQHQQVFSFFSSTWTLAGFLLLSSTFFFLSFPLSLAHSTGTVHLFSYYIRLQWIPS